MTYVKDISLGSPKKRSKEELKRANELCEEARKKDSRLVKGVFKNIEAPGGNLEFAYRGHRGDPVRVYKFKDGETYEIPLGVAKHINNNTKVPINKYLSDSQGKPIAAPGGYRQRYQFLSTEYM